MTKKQKGFTLIELLIVVAIIGILAAIAIPNLLTAMQRSKQKRTMADIRTIATAWEAMATDKNSYSPAGATFTWLSNPMTYADLSTALMPSYIKSLPQKDGWSREYGYATDATTLAQVYSIRAAGKDGAFDANTYTVGAITTNFDCDIVYSNGSFVVKPEGAQN